MEGPQAGCGGYMLALVAGLLPYVDVAISYPDCMESGIFRTKVVAVRRRLWLAFLATRITAQRSSLWAGMCISLTYYAKGSG